AEHLPIVSLRLFILGTFVGSSGLAPERRRGRGKHLLFHLVDVLLYLLTEALLFRQDIFLHLAGRPLGFIFNLLPFLRHRFCRLIGAVPDILDLLLHRRSDPICTVLHRRSQRFAPVRQLLFRLPGLGLPLLPLHGHPVACSSSPIRRKEKREDASQDHACSHAAHSYSSCRWFHGTDRLLINGSLLVDFLPFPEDRKSTRLNSSHVSISYALFCLKQKTKQ